MFRPIDTLLTIPPFAEVRDPGPPDAQALLPGTFPRAAERELPWPRATPWPAALIALAGLVVALRAWLR